MIFKVQRSLMTTEAETQMLVYNRSRKYFWMGDMPRDISRKMGKRSKVFFHGHLEDTGPTTQEIVLDKEAPWQEW